MDIFEQINEIYNKAMEHKEIAIKSDKNLEDYIKASDFYSKASYAYQTILEKVKNINIDDETDIKQLIEYYMYETYVCKYSYYYKTGQFSEAIKNAKLAKEYIFGAIKIIEDNFKLLNTKSQVRLNGLKTNYLLNNLTIDIKIVEPKARMAMNNANYIDAMDLYKQMGQLQDKVYEYVKDADLEQVYKRIEIGNYYASKASIANTIAGVYLGKDNESEYSIEIMEQFLDAHRYIKLASETNPEWDLYKNGKELTKENIKELLFSYKDKWEIFMNEFNNDPILNKIINEIKIDEEKTNDITSLDIFLSYSWNNDSIADRLEELFSLENIMLIRDKKEIKYKQSIKEFMRKVRKSDFCLMIISDDYLKSTNCMYEVLEFIKDENFKERILPLIHKDCGIFRIDCRVKYTQYWENEYKKINDLLSNVENLNQVEIIDECKRIENIKRNVGEFLNIISDMNCISFNDSISIADFKKIYSFIFPKTKKEEIYKNNKGYFILNVPRTINEENILWWEKNDGEYTREIYNAKIFAEKEMLDIINEINGNKKFCAIPVNSFITKLEQNRIPWDFHFKEIFAKNKFLMIGNTDIYLTDTEIKSII